jgi:D-alanyl-D-alanine carboxypeptidase (penicillin-binding protein 5/6)
MIGYAKRIAALVLALGLLAQPAAAFDTRATAAYVIDLQTGTVMLDKNATGPMPPASMSKLMTLYMTFEALRDGRLRMDEALPVSSHAMSYGGSTMFLDTTDRVKVSDLVRGIIVLSGNDACAVLAETLSPDGTEDGFARQMTLRAQQLGMTNSVFRNASGWPAPGHVMSMQDLAILGQRLIEDFPEYYPMFSETRFEFDGRAPQNVTNRNPLLGLGIGADGLKTGHTQEAGYGLVGSARQGDRRIVFVVTGLATAQARAEESQAIVNWAFRQFAQRKLAAEGQLITTAPVWMGAEPRVGLVPKADFNALLPVVAGNQIEAEVQFSAPFQAPIEKGAELGQLVVKVEGLPEMRVPLVADRSVARGGFVSRVVTASTVLLRRLDQGPEDAF